MKYELLNIKACCGKTKINIKLEGSILQIHLNIFSLNGFDENGTYTNAGMFYVENKDLLITAPFGSNLLKIKCKNKDCDIGIKNLEKIIELL